jgi:methanethiol S-methyltransferase
MSGPIILSVAVLIYAVMHSLSASLAVKAWAHRQIGPDAERWYRLIYNVFAVISGLPILALLFILPDHPLYQVPFPWILLTGAGQLIGILIIVVGILQTDLWQFAGLRQIMNPAVDSDSPMVTTGLYHWMRHPLYTGGLLLIWLVPTMTLNLLTIFIWLTLYLIVGANLEEKRLLHEFGDAYREYQQCVPMLIPFPRRAK